MKWNDDLMMKCLVCGQDKYASTANILKGESTVIALFSDIASLNQCKANNNGYCEYFNHLLAFMNKHSKIIIHSTCRNDTN